MLDVKKPHPVVKVSHSPHICLCDLEWSCDPQFEELWITDNATLQSPSPETCGSGGLDGNSLTGLKTRKEELPHATPASH